MWKMPINKEDGPGHFHTFHTNKEFLNYLQIMLYNYFSQRLSQAYVIDHFNQYVLSIKHNLSEQLLIYGEGVNLIKHPYKSAPMLVSHQIFSEE